MNGRPASRIQVADMTVIALVGVMILLGKTLLRVPISISGHAGILWIAALLIGRGVVRKPGSATLMALVGGLLVAIAQPNDSGLVFTVAKYLLAGVTMDALAPLLDDRFDRLAPAAIVGALALAGKVAIDLVQGLVAGVPASVLAVGLTASLALHMAFGALGGAVAAFVLRALVRARIPQLADVADRGAAR